MWYSEYSCLVHLVLRLYCYRQQHAYLKKEIISTANGLLLLFPSNFASLVSTVLCTRLSQKGDHQYCRKSTACSFVRYCFPGIHSSLGPILLKVLAFHGSRSGLTIRWKMIPSNRPRNHPIYTKPTSHLRRRAVLLHRRFLKEKEVKRTPCECWCVCVFILIS